jgi:hypothetical protein
MQPKNLSAPTASPAKELQEDTARAHAKVHDADFAGDFRAVVSLKGHRDMRHVGRQNG